jgi:hypothetical protein
MGGRNPKHSMACWISQEKAEEPWAMFDTCGGRDTYQTFGPKLVTLDNNLSLGLQTSLFQSRRISKL